jgi:hypothetical protein
MPTADDLDLLHAIRAKMAVLADEVPAERAKSLLSRGWIEERHGVVFHLVRGQGRVARRGQILQVSHEGLDFLRGMR